jgi:hemoglobin-like flavoprotein
MITPQQKVLVQSTWELVHPISGHAATLFYGKLFELDPSLKALFTGDMQSQGIKLMKTLGIAVNGLNNLEAIVPVVRELGQRHVGYGVKEAHYSTVGEALLWTLGQGLGDAFTPDVEKAWASVYGVLSGVMIEASKSKVA